MFFFFCGSQSKNYSCAVLLNQVEKENDGGGECVKMINIDEGKHKRTLEKETLFGKAGKGYTARITGEQTKVPTFVFYAASKRSVDEHSPLEMG